MRTFDDKWRARFERFGWSYAEEHEVSGWSAEGLARRFALFQRLLGQLPLPGRARILEFGCGAGTYVRYLAGLGHWVVGVDYSMPTLERALAADPGRKGHYVAGDGYGLPFAAGRFDLVTCIGVLQAVSQPERLLDEVARVLPPGGIVVVEALNGLGLPAIGGRLLELVLGRPPRLRSYPHFRVRRWLEQRKIRLTRRLGVYLPPRRLPWMGRVLNRPQAIQVVEGIPGGAQLGAHAFWLVGEKLP